MDESQRISLACETLRIHTWLVRKKVHSVFLASLIGLAQILYDWNEVGFATAVSMRFACGRLFNAILVAILMFCLLYFIPLKVAMNRIHRLARQTKVHDGEFVLELNPDCISITSQHGSRTVFYHEVDQLVGGRVGYFLLSGREIVLCFPRAAIDFESLSSVLPSSVVCLRKVRF